MKPNDFGFICWNFNEGSGNIASDVTGKYQVNLHGVVWAKGLHGTVVCFNGVNNFIETSLKIDESGSSDYTFVTWVCPAALKAEKNHSGRQQVISTDDGNFDWSLFEASEHWQIFTGTQVWDSDIPVDMNMWQHIAVVFKAGQDTILYKNGIAKHSNLIPGSDGSWNWVTIGNNPGGWNEPFNGMIGKTMIFKKALTTEEIRKFYQDDLNGITKWDTGEVAYDGVKSDVPFTEWMDDPVFHQHLKANEKKGLWLTGIEARLHNGGAQFRIREEPVPADRAYWWYWWFYQDEPSINKFIHEYTVNGFRLAYFQSLKLSDGQRRYQGIWQKVP